MKTKLFIALFLLQTSFCIAYNRRRTISVGDGNHASIEIKNAISERFNKWLIKGEFEKNSEYEIRVRNANDSLQKITNQVVNDIKDGYLHHGADWHNDIYNVESETMLILGKEGGFWSKDSLIISIPPIIAKTIKAEHYEPLVSIEDVSIVNDEWKITKALIGWGNIDRIRRDGNEVTCHDKSLLRIIEGNNIKTLSSSSAIEIGRGKAWYYDWKITEQPHFNTASIKPVSIKLEDLNITLPTFNTEITSATTKPQVPDLDMNSVKTRNSNPTAFALVIGNKDYQYTKKVQYALNDAETMKKYLVNVLGYSEGNIYYIENATKSTFETYFGNKENPDGKLFNNIKQGVTDVFIYYAGHGAPGLKDNKGYFVPVDCDPQYVQQGGYSLDLFYANIAKLNAKSVTIVTDACFSGAEIFKDISPITITVSNPIAIADNCVVLSSSAGSQVSSWYNDKQHGMFTYFFLKALQDKEKSDKNKDGKLTFEEIYEYVSDKTEGVPYYARSIHGVDQTPTIQGTAKDNTFIEYK